MIKDLKITPPDGYEIDKEKSTFENLVFKKIKNSIWSRDILNESGNMYYYLTRTTTMGFETYNSTIRNSKLIYTYPTEELAEKEAHIFRTMQTMRHWARFHNELDGWKANWNNLDQWKWGIEIIDSALDVDWYSNANPFIFGISVSSEDRAKQMLEEFKEDLEKITW